MADLKPCPFCGGRSEYKPAFGVACIRCDAGLPCTLDDAQAAWNHRPAEAALDDMTRDRDQWRVDCEEFRRERDEARAALATARADALRDARQRINDLVAERQADLHGARNDFNKGAVDALQEACAAILALIDGGRE